MFEMIIAKLGGAVVEKMFGGIVTIANAYINKQVSEIEAKKQMYSLLVGASKDVEVANSNDLRETYKAFMDTMKTSMLMQVMWAAALASQIFVLVWSQWAVPMLYAYDMLGNKGWHAGTSAEWAYLIVIALLGMGPVVLRSGPAARNPLSNLSSMIGKK